jgi:hypothetical protein
MPGHKFCVVGSGVLPEMRIAMRRTPACWEE